MTFTESGITINLNPNLHPFRFETCDGYIRIKGQSVTEMDVCWIDASNSIPIIWLMELKQLFDPANPMFQEKDITSKKIYNDFMITFYKNVWHSISMIAQNRSETQSCSSTLSPNLIEESSLKVVFILNIQPNLKHHLNGFQKDLKHKLMDAIAVFKIDSVAVLAYDDAKILFPTIVL